MSKEEENQRGGKSYQKNNKSNDFSKESSDRSKISNYIEDWKMREILSKKGIVNLFPIQYETFNYIRQGQDIVAKDRTGSGKTLAFALPIITRMRSQSKFKGRPFPRFLVMLPTRELAIQVKDEIASLRLHSQDDFIVAAIYGGSGIQDQLAVLNKGVDIIVGTPGRVIDFMARGAIKLSYIQVVCLDQADQMLNIGFKQEIEKIFRFISSARKQKVQWLMFSATIPEWIWKMSSQYQSSAVKYVDMIKNESVKTSKTVTHFCIYSSQQDKEYYIEPIFNEFLGAKRGKTIIFCETKRQVDRIGQNSLVPRSVAMLHGDYNQYERERIFHEFKKGNLCCLIATNVAARGLDFPEIDLIIQMQPPPTTDTYIHRSGRTGRVGKSGTCVTLYNNGETFLMQKIEYEAKISFSHIDPDRFWCVEPICMKREDGALKRREKQGAKSDGRRKYE